MKRKNIQVIQETNTGLNQVFFDPTKGRSMSRTEFVKKIEKGYYEGYHILHLNNKKIPRSNPDGKQNNNLD